MHYVIYKSTSTFPDKAKGAFLTQVERDGNDERVYTNYRLVSALNTFSKFIELLIFYQLTGCANHFLSTFVSAYCGVCGAQYVPIGSFEEWREQLDQYNIVGTVI